MKPRASSLNPYAASYIPLKRREADGGTSVAYNDCESYEGPVGFQTPQHTTQDQYPLHPNTRAFQKRSTSQAYHVKSQPESSSSGSAMRGSFQMADKQMLDEESDMDLEYLRMTFPGISDQSLTDVYMVNGGDLEASIDMLNLLESDSLPETLDIGDTSESGNVADSASLKLKKAAAEAGTSSSPSTSASVS